MLCVSYVVYSVCIVLCVWLVWSTTSDHRTLCWSDMTCCEPEAHGEIVKGLEFHKFFLDNSSNGEIL